MGFVEREGGQIMLSIGRRRDAFKTGFGLSPDPVPGYARTANAGTGSGGFTARRDTR